MLIHILQIATLVAWAITGILVSPGTWRMFFLRVRIGDASKSVLFFVSLAFVAGQARWLLAPDSKVTWAFVYGLTILSAAYSWVVVYNIRRDL